MKRYAILILLLLAAVAFGQQSETNTNELRANSAVIVGNAAWHSHSTANPDHTYEGRA